MAIATREEEGHLATRWPAGTDVCCWYCTYGFDSSPIALPVRYDDKRRVFYVTGVFCTWGCAKRYNGERDYVGKLLSGTLLTLFRHKILGNSATNDPRPYGITLPPHRSMLKRFGGSMTIEEFRNGLQFLDRESIRPRDARLAIGEADIRGEIPVSPTVWGDATGGSPPMRCTRRLLDPATGPVYEDREDDNERQDREERPSPVEDVHAARRIARREAAMLDSINRAPVVQNNPYKLKRSKPLGSAGNTLFDSMNLKVERSNNA